MVVKSREVTQKQTLTVVMVDVVGSSKGHAFIQSECTKQTWRLYEKICNLKNPLTRNTWGDGLVVSFANVMDAINFARALFNEATGDDYNFLQFRIAIHHDTTEIVDNPIRGGKDLIGDGIFKAARLEPVIYNGSTLVTEEVYAQLKNKKGINVKSFTAPLPVKAAKNAFHSLARYFLECCTKNARLEIRRQQQKVSLERNISTKLWFELIEDAYNDGTDISNALDKTTEIIVCFINGGETGKSLVDALGHRLRKSKQNNNLQLKKITLATLKVEGANQDKMLKESGLLTNKRGTHKEMVGEIRKRFDELVEKLDSDVVLNKVDIPWPPLGAILITDSKIYVRPSVYFEDVNHFPVICAGQMSDYYKKYSRALTKVIKNGKT